MGIWRNGRAPLGKGAVVTVISIGRSDPRGAGGADRSTFTRTDSAGGWRFDGLPPGRYLVAINLRQPPSLGFPYVQTYHRTAAERADAAPIEVVEGRQVRIDLQLGPRLPSRAIAGVVLDEHGTPLPGAYLTVRDAEFPKTELSGTEGISDATGRFVLRVLEGRRYIVYAISDKPVRRGQLAGIPSSGDLTGLRIVVKP